jgi:hypothetical protein
MLARTPADRSDRPTLAAWRREPDGRPRVRMGSRAPIAAMAGIGGALTVIGGLAPWLSFFAGLQPVRGIDGSYGLAVVVLGLLAVVTAGLHLIPGRAATRWLLGGLGFAILAISGYLGITLLMEFSVLAADPLLIARIEPGLGIALLGGSLLGATLFAPEETVTEAHSTRGVAGLHLGLAALLLVAGSIHLVLAPEHLADSTVLGIGFLAVGIIQVVVAPLLLIDPNRRFLSVALAISALSALALLAAVTLGLPFVGHGEDMGLMGPVETLDDLAALTLVAEVTAALLSIRLLRRF